MGGSAVRSREPREKGSKTTIPCGANYQNHWGINSAKEATALRPEAEIVRKRRKPARISGENSPVGEVKVCTPEPPAESLRP